MPHTDKDLDEILEYLQNKTMEIYGTEYQGHNNAIREQAKQAITDLIIKAQKSELEPIKQKVFSTSLSSNSMKYIEDNVKLADYLDNRTAELNNILKKDK